MKVLFLDIDGVLNYESFTHDVADLRRKDGREGLIVMPEAFHGPHQIDPAKVALLNQIVKRTGCKVVISSSWREGRYNGGYLGVAKMLRFHNFVGEVIGGTPTAASGKYTGCKRGGEIWEWLLATYSERKEGIHYAILDDDGPDQMIGAVEASLVRTSMDTGLLPEHVERVVEMLGETDAEA